ncbi:MAG: hypothetical protein U0P46_03940 [Holophagaceae bacterium]
MMSPVERRLAWSRIVGVERRSAPLQSLEGHPLPDPTRLEDEEFAEAQARLAREKREALARFDRWDRPGID